MNVIFIEFFSTAYLIRPHNSHGHLRQVNACYLGTPAVNFYSIWESYSGSLGKEHWITGALSCWFYLFFDLGESLHVTSGLYLFYASQSALFFFPTAFLNFMRFCSYNGSVHITVLFWLRLKMSVFSGEHYSTQWVIRELSSWLFLFLDLGIFLNTLSPFFSFFRFFELKNFYWRREEMSSFLTASQASSQVTAR